MDELLQEGVPAVPGQVSPMHAGGGGACRVRYRACCVPVCSIRDLGHGQLYSLLTIPHLLGSFNAAWTRSGPQAHTGSKMQMNSFDVGRRSAHQNGQGRTWGSLRHNNASHVT